MEKLLLTILWTATLCVAQPGPEVDTVYGTIRGAVDTTEDGSTYERYFGVPFGAPPVGQQRFTKSIPPEPWEGVRDATDFANRCIDGYFAFDTSEDCLYLNVYVPGENRVGDNLAVMVFVYGGSYYFGAGKDYPGQDLAVHGDVIVITTSYRLAALGFLSTEDDAALGNYGLWDVKLSLEWVRDNIAAFGGDPNSVTVFGQSAGASIASHMLISPETQGLVNRAICLSGASAGYFGTAVVGSVAESTRILGTYFGCNTEDSFALVECLRQQDANDLNYYAYTAISAAKGHNPNIIPVVDGEFVPQHPYYTFNQSLPSGLDLMQGATIHDGAGFILTKPDGDFGPTYNYAETKERLDAGFRYAMNQFPGAHDDKKAAVINQYPAFDADDVDVRTRAAVDVETDYWYDCGANYEVDHHSVVGGSTYLYEYAYLNSFYEVLYEPEYSWVIADHSDDLHSVFGPELWKDYVAGLGGEFTAEDTQMSLEMMTYFTNFAKTGNPNEGGAVPVNWPEYTRETRQYLQMSEDSTVLTETAEQLDNYKFWMEDYLDVALPDNQLKTGLKGQANEVSRDQLSEIKTAGREQKINRRL